MFDFSKMVGRINPGCQNEQQQCSISFLIKVGLDGINENAHNVLVLHRVCQIHFNFRSFSWSLLS